MTQIPWLASFASCTTLKSSSLKTTKEPHLALLLVLVVLVVVELGEVAVVELLDEIKGSVRWNCNVDCYVEGEKQQVDKIIQIIRSKLPTTQKQTHNSPITIHSKSHHNQITQWRISDTQRVPVKCGYFELRFGVHFEDSVWSEEKWWGNWDKIAE